MRYRVNPATIPDPSAVLARIERLSPEPLAGWIDANRSDLVPLVGFAMQGKAEERLAAAWQLWAETTKPSLSTRAGQLAMIKADEAMGRGDLPPTMHWEGLRPRFDLDLSKYGAHYFTIFDRAGYTRPDDIPVQGRAPVRFLPTYKPGKLGIETFQPDTATIKHTEVDASEKTLDNMFTAWSGTYANLRPLTDWPDGWVSMSDRFGWGPREAHPPLKAVMRTVIPSGKVTVKSARGRSMGWSSMTITGGTLAEREAALALGREMMLGSGGKADSDRPLEFSFDRYHVRLPLRFVATAEAAATPARPAPEPPPPLVQITAADRQANDIIVTWSFNSKTLEVYWVMPDLQVMHIGASMTHNRRRMFYVSGNYRRYVSGKPDGKMPTYDEYTERTGKPPGLNDAKQLTRIRVFGGGRADRAPQPSLVEDAIRETTNIEPNRILATIPDDTHLVRVGPPGAYRVSSVRPEQRLAILG